MSDQFVAEIRIFPFNFAPTGWAFCDGQLLPLSQNTALFSLLGTTYGGDGKSTFALPDLQGNARCSARARLPFATELGGYRNGDIASFRNAYSHHSSGASLKPVTSKFQRQTLPTRDVVARQAAQRRPITMALQMLLSVVAAFPPNMQPYLTLNFCIALQGIFRSDPSRYCCIGQKIRPKVGRK